jgi:hypothetical protein
MGDLFVQPLWLGWGGARYDLSLGLGLYAPIGEYDEDADDNIGLGFWTGQIPGPDTIIWMINRHQHFCLLAPMKYIRVKMELR